MSIDALLSIKFLHTRTRLPIKSQSCGTEKVWLGKLFPPSLVPTPHAPPGSERSQISWAYPKTVEDQSDCEIANYYIAIPLQH